MSASWTSIAEGALATPALFNNLFDAQFAGDVFNVKRYGAVGDNSTDDTSALTTALAAALAAKGTLFLPPGTYKTTVPLRATGRVSICGAGPDSILRCTASNGTDAIIFSNTTSYIDGWFLGNFAVSTESGGGNAIHLDGCHRGTAINVTVPSCASAGVRLQGILNTFIGCAVTTNHPYTVGTQKNPTHGFRLENGTGYYTGGANGNTFIGCSAEGITSGASTGFDLDGADGTVIMGGASEGNGIGVRLGASVHHNLIGALYMESNSISNISYVDSTLGSNTFLPHVGEEGAGIKAQAIGIADGISTPDTISGIAQMYVDVSDGDLKIVFGDGQVKTIVTDS